MTEITKDSEFDQWLFIKRETEEIRWESDPHLPITLENFPELKNLIISCIKAARRYIKICSFIVSDSDIVQCIQDRLEKDDIAIFILTQLDSKKFNSSYLTEEEIIESRKRNPLDILGTLYDCGAHIRAAASIHAKFFIFDGNFGILTSANITTPSLTFNPESGITLNSEKVIDVEKLFDVIYRFGTTFNHFKSAGNNKRFVIQNLESLENDWLPKKDSYFLFTYDKARNSIYESILRLIREANKEIILSTYSVIELSNLPEFVAEVKNALDRNVKMQIFCRGMNYRSDHLFNCQKLAELGCEIRGDLFNHSKGISNGKEAIIFTANIDGKHGLKEGFEVGAYLDSDQAKALHKFMHWQFNNAPYIFKKNPSREAFFETNDWYYTKKGINFNKKFDGLEIIVRDENSKQDIISYPIWGVYEKDELIGIEAGNKSFYGELKSDKIVLRSKTSRFFNKERYLIRYNSMMI
jgi:hypothetical protein